MERIDNYQIQVRQAQARFLTYDQDRLIRKFDLRHDEDYLYLPMLARQYRISRTSGNTEKWAAGRWADANSHSEVMTLLDLICDSKEDRHISGRWKNMGSFGQMFHQHLLESALDPWAERFQENQEGFHRACRALNGRPLAMGDIAYAIEFFDHLPVAVQLWLQDEEFPPSLRLLWDENATDYIRYETMHFARALLLERIQEEMA